MEDLTEEEIAEKVIKNLEKSVDMESFGRVCFAAPHYFGEGTSSTTTSQQLTQQSAPLVGISKGKEVQQIE